MNSLIMYGYIDLSFFLLCMYFLIYGIVVSSDEGYMGYDNYLMWVNFMQILLGLLGIFIYPILLEAILHLMSLSHTYSESPYEDYHSKLPVVYSSKYNITACGIQKLHPFDAEKYGKGEI